MALERAHQMREEHKEAERRESIKHPVSDEPMDLGENDRTLHEIFKNKKEQDFFINRYLYDKDPDAAKGIVEALADNTVLTPDQETFLEGVRIDYNLNRANVIKVREMLTDKEILRVAEVDPRIKEIVGQIGPEAAAKLMRDQFEEYALSDNASFNQIVAGLREVRKIETGDEAKQLDKNLTELLKASGISEQKFTLATGLPTEAESKEELAELVAEKYGWLRKSLDSVSRGRLSMRGGRALYANYEEQQRLLAECDVHRQVIGEFLRGTINTDVRLAIQKFLVEGGSIKEKKIENNVSTIVEYRTVKEEFNTLQPRWETFKAAEIKRRNITNIAGQPAVLETMKNQFAEAEMRKRAGYKAAGALATLITFMFSSGPNTKDDIKSVLA